MLINDATMRGTMENAYGIFQKKNQDYQDSFEKSLERFGAVAGLIRISDKHERSIKLMTIGDQKVNDESIIDTLIDQANYCYMLATYLNEKRKADDRAGYTIPHDVHSAGGTQSISAEEYDRLRQSTTTQSNNS
jgi:hypothetical protein